VEGSDTVNALVVRDLYLSRGAREVLSGVSFDVSRGELVALMGASGSGKTTILRAVAALERVDRGTIVVDGVEWGGAGLKGESMRRLRSALGMVFQFHCLFEHLTALQNVTLAPIHARRVAVPEAERHARALLDEFDVGHRALSYPRELSGGEAQRVAIARALAVDPPLLLMDEPTASLDSGRRSELGDLLRRLVARGKTLLIATHDEEFARTWATRVLRLSGGRVTAD
jgi:ABC-type polar amino acid transport system ATPase subunit